MFAAAEQRLNLNVEMHPLERTEYERDLAAIRTQLGETAFAAAWSEGHTMTLDQALAMQESAILSQSLTSEPAVVPLPPNMAFFQKEKDR